MLLHPWNTDVGAPVRFGHHDDVRPFARVAWLGALAASACSFLDPLSGLTGGVEIDAEAPDGSAESGTLPEDAAPAPDAEKGPFCPRVDATFCEDWDDPSTLVRWGTSPRDHAELRIDDAAAASPPNALSMRTEALDGATLAKASNSVLFDASAESFAYAFDVRVERRGQSKLVVAGMRLTDRGDDHVHYLWIALGAANDIIEEARMGENETVISHPLSRPLPTGTWTRVRVAASAEDAGGYHLDVSYDGEPVLEAAATLWQAGAPGTPYFYVGADFLKGPSTPWEVRFDNATVDLR
jgi:hypothetical protein